MFCTKCGAQNPDDSKFCGKCGAAFDGTPIQQSPPPPWQPPPRKENDYRNKALLIVLGIVGVIVFVNSPMGTLIFLLMAVLLVLLFFGIKKPAQILRWCKEPTRQKVVRWWAGASIAVLLIAIAIDTDFIYFLIVVPLVLLFLGLMNPALILQWSKEPTQLKVAGCCAGAFVVVLAVAIGIDTAVSNANTRQIATERQQQQKEQKVIAQQQEEQKEEEQRRNQFGVGTWAAIYVNRGATRIDMRLTLHNDGTVHSIEKHQQGHLIMTREETGTWTLKRESHDGVDYQWIEIRGGVYHDVDMEGNKYFPKYINGENTDKPMWMCIRDGNAEYRFTRQ